MYLCTQNGKVMKNDETSKKVKNHHDIVSIKYADNKEFKSKRRPIHISFSIHNTKIGKLVVASTAKGICYVGYPIKGLTYVEQLKERFPNAKIKNRIAKINPLIREALKKEWDKNLKIPSIWKELLFNIRCGRHFTNPSWRINYVCSNCSTNWKTKSTKSSR